MDYLKKLRICVKKSSKTYCSTKNNNNNNNNNNDNANYNKVYEDNNYNNNSNNTITNTNNLIGCCSNTNYFQTGDRAVSSEDYKTLILQLVSYIDKIVVWGV